MSPSGEPSQMAHNNPHYWYTKEPLLKIISQPTNIQSWIHEYNKISLAKDKTFIIIKDIKINPDGWKDNTFIIYYAEEYGMVNMERSQLEHLNCDDVNQIVQSNLFPQSVYDNIKNNISTLFKCFTRSHIIEIQLSTGNITYTIKNPVINDDFMKTTTIINLFNIKLDDLTNFITKLFYYHEDINEVYNINWDMMRIRDC